MTPPQDKDGMEERFDKKFGSYVEGAYEEIEDANLGDEIKKFFRSESALAVKEALDANKISDGYHTFKELYEFRKVYNAALFNEYASQGKYGVHKSLKHSDGEKCFGGGWFIVMATLPTGQISNHYETKDWDMFKCETRDRADKWDGHTPQDVVSRLVSLSNQ